MRDTHIRMTRRSDQPRFLDDIVWFFGIFAVDGRRLYRNPLSVAIVFKSALRDERNRAFSDRFTRAARLSPSVNRSLSRRNGRMPTMDGVLLETEKKDRRRAKLCCYR